MASLFSRRSSLGLQRIFNNNNKNEEVCIVPSVERAEVERFNIELQFSRIYHELTDTLDSLSDLGLKLKKKIENFNHLSSARTSNSDDSNEKPNVKSQEERSTDSQISDIHDVMMHVMNDVMIGQMNMRKLQVDLSDTFSRLNCKQKISGDTQKIEMNKVLQALGLLLSISKVASDRANLIFDRNSSDTYSTSQVIDWSKVKHRLSKYNTALVQWVMKHENLPYWLKSAHEWISNHKGVVLGSIIAISILGSLVAIAATMGTALIAAGGISLGMILSAKFVGCSLTGLGIAAATSSAAVGAISHAGKQVSIQLNSKLIDAVNVLTETTPDQPRSLDDILNALNNSHTVQIEFNEFLRISLDVCPVCHSEFTIDQNLSKPSRQSCSHIYHSDCIKAVDPKRCPCCRLEYQDYQRVKII